MKHKPKKLLSGLLAAAMMLSAAPFGMLGGEQPAEMNIPGISKAKASDAEEEVKLVEVKAEDVLTFEIVDGEAYVTNCAESANGNKLVIPSVYDGCPVTIINTGAFSDCGWIVDVTVPEGVTELSDSVFSRCSSLISVDLPQSITEINSRAFYFCDNLLTITLPSELKYICSEAFYGSGLTKISIPASVECISSDAFEGCSALAEINVDSRNTNYCDDNGILFNKSKTEIICYPAGKTESGYAIPSGVDTIYSCAFYGSKSLKEIKIPDGVTLIGYSAFSYCESLKTVSVPAGVTAIGSDAFFYCESLETVNIPAGITAISSGTFEGCKALKKIKIPDGVTSIGSSAFSGCESLDL